MEIAEANLRLNGLRLSDVTTPNTTKEEEVSVPTTAEEDVSVPTRIEEQGRKYCCAKCYKSDGRVIHVALEGTVTLEPNAIVSKGLKRRKGQLYYTNRDRWINSRRVEAGKLDHPAGPIRIFNVICNFCDEVVGWHYTARRVGYLNHVYWYDTLMDREKVVLLNEEETEIANDEDLEAARMAYLMAKREEHRRLRE